jgi:tetratricopeptide (TPR) repeat protein
MCPELSPENSKRRDNPHGRKPHRSVKTDQKPPDLRGLFWQWVSRKFKPPLNYIIYILLALLIGSVFSWDKIQHFPVVKQVVTWWDQQPLPKADTHRFAVAVAHLDNDEARHFEKLIIEALKEVEGVQPLHIDRLIPLQGTYPEEMEKAGHKKALEYLQKTGAQVLIWGTVITTSGKSVPKIYWAVSKELDRAQTYGRYKPTDHNDLPPIFWDDLAEIFRLLIATQYAEFAASRGQYVGNQIRPFIEKVRRLLKGSENRLGWNREARSQTRVILANSLGLLGRESGERQPMEEAVQAYREALKEFTRERAPLKSAEAQNNLGVVLLYLGERERGTKYLEEAVQAFLEALKESTRDRDPLKWAITQNNLGIVLYRLGEREEGTKHLEEAVQVCREALKERTRERVPLDWATTQNNLGNALAILGDRTSSFDLLCTALDAHCSAWEILNGETPFYASKAINAIRGDLSIMGKRFTSEEFRGCLERNANVLNQVPK